MPVFFEDLYADIHGGSQREAQFVNSTLHHRPKLHLNIAILT